MTYSSITNISTENRLKRHQAANFDALPIATFQSTKSDKFYKVTFVNNAPVGLEARENKFGVKDKAYDMEGARTDDQKKRYDLNYHVYYSMLKAFGADIANEAAEKSGLPHGWVDRGTPLTGGKIRDVIEMAQSISETRRVHRAVVASREEVAAERPVETPPQRPTRHTPASGQALPYSQPGGATGASMPGQGYAPRSFVNQAATASPHIYAATPAHVTPTYVTPAHAPTTASPQSYPQPFAPQPFAPQASTPYDQRYNPAPAQAAAPVPAPLQTAPAAARDESLAARMKRTSDAQAARNKLYDMLDNANVELAAAGLSARLNTTPEQYRVATENLNKIYASVFKGDAITVDSHGVYEEWVRLGVNPRDYAAADATYRQCHAALADNELLAFKAII